MIITDCVPAYTLEVSDQVLINGDPIEITSIVDTDDIDEVLIRGFSHDTGDIVEYGLYADDEFEIWSI